MTPAGTSNELEVQNEWEEKTHTHTHKSHVRLCFEGQDEDGYIIIEVAFQSLPCTGFTVYLMGLFFVITSYYVW